MDTYPVQQKAANHSFRWAMNLHLLTFIEPLKELIMANHRHYTFFSFLFDVIMVCVTGGLWLIWIFVREMRNR